MDLVSEIWGIGYYFRLKKSIQFLGALLGVELRRYEKTICFFYAQAS